MYISTIPSTIITVLLLSLSFLRSVPSALQHNKEQTLGLTHAVPPDRIHPVQFFERDHFYAGVEYAAKHQGRFPYHVRGGVIPHHLFPGYILADFFQRLSSQNPQTLILIGPNHYERGNFKALTSRYAWQTPFGTVLPHQPMISSLMETSVLHVDEQVLPEDHAVAGILPFISYYLPDTRVVPILLSGQMTEEESMVLAKRLLQHVDKETVVIAPVDFSHYLNSRQAQEKDKVTLSVLKQFDYRTLFSLNSDYLDSPPSIAVLLMSMQQLGSTKMDLLHHTNSGQLQQNDTIETTSYFSIAYH